MYLFFMRIGLILFFMSSAAQAHLKIQEVISDQGIKAWLVEDHTIPVIALQVSFKGGTAYVPSEKAGVPNLVASMLDEGAGPLTSREFNEKLQKFAISWKADAGADELTLALKTTAEHRQQAFELLKFALTAPRFDLKEFEKVRDSLLTYLKVKEKTLDYLGVQAFKKMAMKGHPYGNPSIGTKETLKSLTPEDLREFARKAFTRETLRVSVCGAITPHELKEVLDALFGVLPEKSSLPELPPFKEHPEGIVNLIPADFPQSQVLFFQEGLKPQDKDYICLILLNHILGSSPSSRLYARVRAEKGYVYSISTSPENYEKTSFFLGDFGSDTRHVKSSLALVQQIWKEVKDKGVTPVELEEAKSHVLGAFVLNLAASESIASLIHAYQKWGYPIDYPEKRAKRIQEVSLERLNGFIREFLTPDLLTFIVVGKSTPELMTIASQKKGIS